MLSKRCKTCNKIFFKKPSDSKKYWKVKKYCSVKCSGTLISKDHVIGVCNRFKKGSFGKLNKSYKGGRSKTSNGYIRILVEGARRYGRYRGEHRILMEKFLGRKLLRSEIVHHINHDRTDNRIENLLLLPKKEHDRLETKKRWVESPESFNRKLKRYN